MLSSSTPRAWKSLLFCRSTTCRMQPVQVEPMLKYRSTALRRNSPSETVPPWAAGRLNAGAGSPTRGPAPEGGGDPALPPPPQAADARPRRAIAAARNEPRILIAAPPAWPDAARTPRRRSRRGHSAPPGCGPAHRSGGRTCSRPTRQRGSAPPGSAGRGTTSTSSSRTSTPSHRPAPSISSLQASEPPWSPTPWLLAALVQQPLDLVGQHLVRGRPDLLESDDAVPADEEGLRHAGHAVVQGGASSGILHHRPVASHLPHEHQGGAIAILEVDADQDHALVRVPVPRGRECGMLFPAGGAPRGPEVDDHDLTPQVGQANRSRPVERLQGEARRPPAEERRTDDVGIATQPEPEQRGEQTHPDDHAAHPDPPPPTAVSAARGRRPGGMQPPGIARWPVRRL